MAQRPKTEEALVRKFLRVAKGSSTPWGRLACAREFDTGHGRADLVACNAHGSVLAFEAKLQDWRRALQQAYRHTSYATESYVLLPKARAAGVVSFSSEFKVRKVGLCYLDGGGIVVAIKALPGDGFQPWISVAVKERLRKSNDRRAQKCGIPVLR